MRSASRSTSPGEQAGRQRDHTYRPRRQRITAAVRARQRRLLTLADTDHTARLPQHLAR
jgi:hypothetical protein